MRSGSVFPRACVALTSAVLTIPVPASAHVQIDGSAALVSDYRYRGISLSDGRPAAQAGLEMTADGWFAGAWASTTRNNDKPGAEVDLYAGWRGAVGTSRYSLTGYYYVDPRRSVMNYAELQALFSRPMGGVELELEASVAPEQTHIDEPNIYLAAGLSLPLKSHGVSLSAHAGYENGSWHRKTDWDVGADYHHAAPHIGAHLIGVTGPACHGALPGGGRTALVGSARVDL
jgi:uncharacterized protein (TIGR02001 family)